MDENGIFLMSLLSAFVNRVAPKPAAVDWERVYHFAKIHGVEGIVYLMSGQLGQMKPDAEIYAGLEKDFYITSIRSATKEEDVQKVTEAFIRNRVPHLFVKGFLLRDFYPVKEMRTMGDIDLVVHAEDLQQAGQILSKLGYTPGPGESEDKAVFVKGVTRIEVHTAIIRGRISSQESHTDFFEDFWGNTEAEPDGLTYRLTPDYRLLFLIGHIAKHFYGNGCGIRPIMDIALYLRAMKGLIHWDVIWSGLRQMHLLDFGKNILSLCRRWFQISVPKEVTELPEPLYREVSAYILEGGIFGLYRRGRMPKDGRRYGGGEIYPGGRCRLLWNMIFPDYRYLCMSVPFVKGRPLLLPAAWIYRLVRGATVRCRHTAGTLRDVIRSSLESERQYTMLKKLGL